MSVRVTVSDRAVSNRWPHIGRALHVDATGTIEDDFFGWSWSIRDKLSAAEQAAAYEQWADFYEWRLAQRADELANDRIKRHLVEQWTDSMVYCCRRSAAWARGADPGEWIPQHLRRPDLDAVSRAIVAEIVAALDADDDRDADRQMVGAGVAG